MSLFEDLIKKKLAQAAKSSQANSSSEAPVDDLPESTSPTNAIAKQDTPQESIGVAEMSNDGTITLHLRAESTSNDDRIIGDAILVYKKGYPNYKAVLDHLEGLHPGESMIVRPWPDENAPKK